MSIWTWIPGVRRFVLDLEKNARATIDREIARASVARNEAERLQATVNCLEAELADVRARLAAKNEGAEILRDRLEKRDAEYDKLHIRYLSIVDRQAAITAERIGEHRPIVPPRPPPTLESIRRKAVTEDQVAGEVPKPPSVEEIEARFQREN